MQNPNQIVFFDTTLRDGEQSPGCTMHLDEKLRMAHQLRDLGVDILEAGFAIASEGDFEAVQTIAREVTGHLDISQADLYIRRLGTPADTIQLDLTPPTRHTTP